MTILKNKKIKVFGLMIGLILGSGCAEFSEVVHYGSRPSSTESPPEPIPNTKVDERVDARVDMRVASAPPEGSRVYVVAAGDTLLSIAAKFHVTDQQVSHANQLDPMVALKPGQKLVIPEEPLENPQEVVGKINEAQAKKAGKADQSDRSDTSDLSDKSDKKLKFIWPVAGIVTSPFGDRHGRDHDGIDIGAPKGTPVVAAADAEVIYVGRINGYGNIVILKHAGNFFTAYAHLSQYQTRKGSHVKQGQTIGKVGRTGHASATHLHFEMRYKTRSKDPQQFLPKTGKDEDGKK